METIKFVDTTIRDGHQSLWAEEMTARKMLLITKNLHDALRLFTFWISP